MTGEQQIENRGLTLSEGVKRLTSNLLIRHFPRLWLTYQVDVRRRHFEQEYWLVPLFCAKNALAMMSAPIGANIRF